MNQEEVNLRMNNILDSITELLDDPSISTEDKLHFIETNVGYLLYQFCNNIHEFDYFTKVLRQKFLKIKGQDLRRRN